MVGPHYMTFDKKLKVISVLCSSYLEEGKNGHQKFCHIIQSLHQYILRKSHTHQPNMLDVSSIKTEIVIRTNVEVYLYD